MAGILKSRGLIYVGIAAVIGAGTYFSMKQTPAPKEEAPAAKQEKARPKATASSPSLPPAEDPTLESTQEKPAPVVSNATISKDTMATLRETLAKLADFRSREKSKDKDKKRPDRAEKNELNAKLKGVRGEVAKAVRESDAARKQLMAAIKDEKDPYVKKELARYMRDADTGAQEKYFTDLARDPSTDNQKVAVEMMGQLRTQSSLKNLVGMAESPSVAADVRESAIRAVGMSIPFAADDTEYQQSARGALVGMIQPQNDASSRESAFRALAMQTSLSPDEELAIIQAAEKETDPKVKRMADFARNVIDARKGSAPR